ncbi:DUF4274 domain-containing protein [Stenotrophomonas hibiscicola]|uniref:DUF4274 domain-containing protein n=1 Tax=Stenotrophomonas hibiscicola TaxID=86189 RepID=UPI002E796205|nr:DUF4274 domain-containing protein [[Pseudomonas] hibiscicola]
MTPDDYHASCSRLLQDYLHTASPEQRHIYVARRNYDDSPDVLAWLAEQRDLDRATALLMHASLGAGRFAQYADASEVPGHEQAAYALVRRIEQRCLDGFYADHGLDFDPFAEAVDDAYDDGLPFPIAQQLHDLAAAFEPERGPALGDATAGDVDIWAEVVPPALSPVATASDPGWPLLVSFLQQATPQQRHQLMLFADTHTLSDALQWLLEQPSLAASSALALYWNLGASWYVPFATVDDVPASHRHTAAMLRGIEQRLAEGGYADQGLGFDLAQNRPRFPARWPGRPVLRAVPEAMWLPRDGQIVEESDEVDFISGLPEEVAGALAQARG